MITRKQALQILREAGCSKEVVQHCLAVERTALSLANGILSKGHKIDIRLVSLGALLHDIGRARTHGITHGIEGGKILREFGLASFVSFAERHIGSGIPANEASKLGLPARDFTPVTLEEKVVTYADKLVSRNRRISFKRSLEDLKSELGQKSPAINRLEELHLQLKRLSAGNN